MPSGAVQRIHHTSLMRAASNASASSRRVSRLSFSSVPEAAASRTVNTIIGSNAPRLAASNGFRGIKLTRNSTMPGSSGAVCGPAEGTDTGGVSANPTVITAMPMGMATSRVTQKNPREKPPSLPSLRGSPNRHTPVKIVAMTRGITTMLMAFMKASPSGADPAAIAWSSGLPVALARRPTINPAMRPAPMRMWIIGYPGAHGGLGRLGRRGPGPGGPRRGERWMTRA